MSSECSLALRNFDDEEGSGSHFVEDRYMKKIRFKEGIDDGTTEMVVDPVSIPNPLWKDKLLGRESVNSVGDRNIISVGKDSNFVLLMETCKRPLLMASLP